MKIKNFSTFCAFVAILFVPFAFAEDTAEEWKGAPPEHEWSAGGVVGLGIYDGDVGFTVLGNVAKKIVHQGFIPDVNNQVFLEGQIGPTWVYGSTAWIYGAHLRWDFPKNDQMTLFALGGVGGSFTGSKLGNSFRMYPRFGVGAFFAITDMLKVRTELSHNLIGAGITAFF